MNNIGGLRSGPADEEIVGLDVPVDQILFVDGLNSWQLERGLVKIKNKKLRKPSYHLLGHHHNGFDREPSVAVIE